VKFASKHNLRLVVKSSGHDYLGRSTAPNSLLIHTAKLTKISFTDSFFVGKQNMGSAVTVDSGVHIQTLYQAGKAKGKTMVSGSAATVCPSGGYIQGAGHSALGPTFGMAADNALGELPYFFCGVLTLHPDSRVSGRGRQRRVASSQ
jgi:FAD/FMN-containing dehydrogenase